MPHGVRVVVIDYDGADVLPRCLASLLSTIGDVPVTVIDNASPVPSQSLVPENLADKMNVIPLGQNTGYAGAIAWAWDNLAEKYLVIANNDLVFTPGWLDKLVETADKTGAYAVSAVIEHENDTELEKSTNASLNPLFYLLPGVFKDRTKAVYPSGACFLLRNDKNIPCPVDPEYFLYYEDAYIGLFLRAIGKEVVQCPDAVVRHAGSHSVRRSDSNKIAFLQERNRLLTYIYFTNLTELITLSPCVFYDSIIKPITCFARHKPFWATASAHWWILFHLVSIWRKRSSLRKIPGFDARRNYPYYSGKWFPDGVPTASIHNALSKWWWKLVGIPVDKEAGK